MKPTIILLAMLAITVHLGAAEGVADTLNGNNYPPFVDTAANHLEGDLTLLERLFGQLDTLQRTPCDSSAVAQVVNIVHLGDSHVQAGFIATTVRKTLQSRFGNAGLGVIAPLRLAGTNQPADYTITSPNAWTSSLCIAQSPADQVGITGMALHTSSTTLSFEINAQDSFSQVTVFQHPHSPLLVTVDSLTTGMCCPSEDERIAQIALIAPVRHLTLWGDCTVDSLYNYGCYYGFSLENGRSGILYHNIGINGNSFAATVRNPQIAEQTGLVRPQLIIVSLGTNDAMGSSVNRSLLEEQISRLIDQIRSAAPHATIILTTPMESYRRVRVRRHIYHRLNTNVATVRECIARQATKQQCLLWDFYTIAGGEEAMRRWNDANLAASDRVHLTCEGYQCMGQLLSDALLKAFDQYCAAKQSPPSIGGDPSAPSAQLETPLETPQPVQ